MLFLAFRHLISRRRQSVLTLLGVALGTAAFVTFSSIMIGFQEFIIEQLVNNDAHVKIQSQDALIPESDMSRYLFPVGSMVLWLNGVNSRLNQSKINNPAGWFERLRLDPEVSAFSPQLNVQVIFSKSGVSVGGRLSGIMAETQSRVTNIENYMVFGSIKSISNPGNHIVIGKDLSDKLGVRVGETMMVDTGGASALPFKVSAIFKIGVKTLDEGMAFAHLSDVQQATHRQNEITDIVVRLFDVSRSQEFANLYGSLSQDKVMSWDQSNSGILSVFTLQNFIRLFITTSIQIVAAFGIYNILNILVNQKRRDIGILRSMGFDRGDISKLFLIQGMALGIGGGILGLGVGYLLGLSIGQYRIGGMIDRMIISHSPQIYIGGFLMAMGAATLSSFLPARSASLLRPIDIVRSGE